MLLLILNFIIDNDFVFAQNNTFRIFLKDKGPEEFVSGSNIYQSTENLYNLRAIKRRLKVHSDSNILTIKDAPLFQPYIDSIESLGASVKLKLRWNNYCVVECDSNTINKIKSFNFIKEIQETYKKMQVMSIDEKQDKLSISEMISIEIENVNNCGDFDYGRSYFQALSLNIPKVHGLGITGNGILLGFLDSGFKWKTNPLLSNLNVKTEYDFIYLDSITENEVLDTVVQHNHGTAVLSTVSAYIPGQIIGIAPNANLLLGKTEDIRHESHLEEDNYAAAVEWMESQGVDVISSSLGYYIMDSTLEDYNANDLDGKSTIVDQSVNYAVSQGVFCVTAAGNRGPEPSTLISPGDADSAVTVGALILTLDSIAKFSSRGPRSDGLIKPDLSALGVDVIAVSVDGTIVKTGGTSLSTPLISGSVGLILSAFPELKPWEVKDILFKSCNRYLKPDNDFGRGIPDIFQAITSKGILISPVISFPDLEFQRILTYIYSYETIKSAKLFLNFYPYFEFREYDLYPTSDKNLFAIDIPALDFGISNAKGYIIADNGFEQRRMPYIEDSLFIISPGLSTIPCGVKQSDLPFHSDDVGVCFINPSLIQDYRELIRLSLLLNENSDIVINIFDMLGKKIQNEIFEHRDRGITEFPIFINNLSSGTYYVVCSINDRIITKTFVIAR